MPRVWAAPWRRLEAELGGAWQWSTVRMVHRPYGLLDEVKFIYSCWVKLCLDRTFFSWKMDIGNGTAHDVASESVHSYGGRESDLETRQRRGSQLLCHPTVAQDFSRRRV